MNPAVANVNALPSDCKASTAPAAAMPHTIVGYDRQAVAPHQVNYVVQTMTGDAANTRMTSRQRAECVVKIAPSTADLA
jgi:hypothetical protein